MSNNFDWYDADEILGMVYESRLHNYSRFAEADFWTTNLNRAFQKGKQIGGGEVEMKLLKRIRELEDSLKVRHSACTNCGGSGVVWNAHNYRSEPCVCTPKR